MLRRHHLLLAGLAVAVAWTTWFSGAGQLGLVGPDEPRYVSIARAMAESGDWVTPRLNGEPWFEKPVLYYWGAATAFSVFGESEMSARLPSAVAMLVASAALVALALRAFGSSVALALAFMLPSMLATIAFARGASTDMVFTATLTLAFVAAVRVVEVLHASTSGLGGVGRGRERLLWLAAWGAALGLAVLAKGPAAVLLAGGSLVLCSLLMRQWRWPLTFAHPVALAAFALVALPWYVLCSLRNPDFVRVFILEHNVQRFLTPVFAHEQPWWYFGAVLLAGLVPWTVALVPTIRDAWWDASTRRTPAATLALCWAVVPLVFFGVSRSKLPGYILPMFPPLAFLMARTMAASLDAPGRGRALLASSGGLLVVVAGLLAGMTTQVVPAQLAPVVATLGITTTWPAAIGTAGIGIALLALRGREWLALGLTSTVMAILVIGVNGRIVPALDPLLSARATAVAASDAAEGGPIFEFGLERTMDFGLDYYLRRDLREWSPEAGEGVVVVRATTARNFAASGYLVEVVKRISADAVITRVRRVNTVRLAPAPAD
ncbi:MAG: glycosyltransferase family 39 protein [Vicinamibacterales bacterium]